MLAADGQRIAKVRQQRLVAPEPLFGLWETRDALAAGARPVIVEGPFDAIAVTIAGQGRFAGLAPCGTAFATRHTNALSRIADLPTAGILVAFDPDPPGRRAAIRAYHLLSQLTVRTSAVTLPVGQDPAQVLAGTSPEALAAILCDCTHPLADLVTDAELEKWASWLGPAEGQISAPRAIAPAIAAMPPAGAELSQLDTGVVPPRWRGRGTHPEPKELVAADLHVRSFRSPVVDGEPNG